MTGEMFGWLGAGIMIGFVVTFTVHYWWRDLRLTSLLNERDQLQQSADNLSIGRSTFQAEADALRRSNGELIAERDKARDANQTLHQGWNKTITEMKPILQENAVLRKTIIQNDSVKAISEARIRELEADDLFTAKRIVAFETSMDQYLQQIGDLERQLAAESQKVLDLRCHHAINLELMNARGVKIEELENALQTIKGCVDDSLTECFVSVEN